MTPRPPGKGKITMPEDVAAERLALVAWRLDHPDAEIDEDRMARGFTVAETLTEGNDPE